MSRRENSARTGGPRTARGAWVPGRRGRLSLRVRASDDPSAEDTPIVGWLATALLAGPLTAFASWAVIVVIILLLWAGGPNTGFFDVVGTGTRLWLSAYGASSELAGVRVSIPPLLLTLLVFMGLVVAAGVAVRAVRAHLWGEEEGERRDVADPGGTNPTGRDCDADEPTVALGRPASQASAPEHTTIVIPREGAPEPATTDHDRRVVPVATLAAAIAVPHAAVIAVAAGLVQGTAGSVRGLLAGFLLGVVAVAVALGRGARARAGRASLLPEAPGWWQRRVWLHALPTAIGLGLGVLAATGCAVLVVGLVLSAERVGALTAALADTPLAVASLWVFQLLWLPDLVVWAGSYALGAGLTIGPDTIVSPGANAVGLVPAIPVAGILPPTGAGGWWEYLWLACGPAAGLLASWWATRRQSVAATWDLAALAGLCSGAGVLLGWLALAWLTRGSLGVDRLADVGPRLLPLLLVGTVTIVVPAVLAAVARAVLRRAPR